MRIFNPYQEQLQGHERLRLVHGKLYVENRTVRAKSCWLVRLFTRGEYSQSKILRYFNRLDPFREQLNNLASQNYDELIHRAENQNRRHAPFSKCVRWFKGKSHINTEVHRDKLIRIGPRILQQMPPALDLNPAQPARRDVFGEPHLFQDMDRRMMGQMFPAPAPRVAPKEPASEDVKALLEGEWDLQKEQVFLNHLEQNTLGDHEELLVRHYFNHYRGLLTHNSDARQDIIKLLEDIYANNAPDSDLIPAVTRQVEEVNNEGLVLLGQLTQNGLVTQRLGQYLHREFNALAERVQEELNGIQDQLQQIKEKPQKLLEWRKLTEEVNQALAKVDTRVPLNALKAQFMALGPLVDRAKLVGNHRAIDVLENDALLTRLQVAKKELEKALESHKRAHPSQAGEIDQLLGKEITLAEALQVMREAQAKAREMGYAAHANKMASFIRLEEQQPAILHYLHGQKRNGVYFNVHDVDLHLQGMSRSVDGNYLIFHAHFQDPEFHIKDFPGAYVQAYRIAKAKNILVDFFQNALNAVCMEGNMTSLIEWTLRHNYGADMDLAAAYDRKEASWQAALGAYHKVFKYVEFRKAFKTLKGKEHEKANPREQELAKYFDDPDNVFADKGDKRENDVFRQKGKEVLTKANFLAFIKAKIQEEPTRTIPYKGGAISAAEFEQKVNEYWAAVVEI